MTAITIPTSFPSQADPAAVVSGPNVRFTVLTSRLIRMEYSRRRDTVRGSRQPGVLAPAAAGARVQGDADAGSRSRSRPSTCCCATRSRDAGFTAAHAVDRAVKANGVTWHFGDHDRRNLRGTARTLDGADGEIELEPGLMSRAGWSLVDDSQSLVFDEDGWLEQRPARHGRGLPRSLLLRLRPRLCRLPAGLLPGLGPRAAWCRATRWATGGAATGTTARTSCAT